MRIIYIDTARLPTEKAHGYQICKMCEEFVNAGAEVELWVPSRDNEIKQDIFSYYGLKNNFVIKKLVSRNFLFLRRLSVRLEFWLRNWSFFLGLLFKKIPKDAIVYTRIPEIVLILGLKRNFIAFESHFWPKRSGLHKFFVRRAGVIIAVTGFLKKKFEENGFASQKILVAPDGVDFDKFNINISKEEARKSLDLPLDRKILGYTGSFKTMEMDKGISMILKALKIILQKDMNVLFAAVGGTDEDIKYYESQALDLGIKNSVIFLKKVSLEKLAIYQKAFDVLLMPFPANEHYNFYMSPLKMFEYMASGRPIIASDLPSVREILNENNAILIQPGDAVCLARAAQQTLLNLDSCDNIAERALDDARVYDWLQRAKNIIGFIVSYKMAE